MRYVSLFSGVEAATVAWSRLGWEPLAFAEVDEFPSAVLAQRFPNVPNLGDVCNIDWKEFHERHGAIDVLIGGSPCQSFSVAGGREGLKGESRLMFEYIRAVRDLVRASGGASPRYIVWENVPGCLSSNKGRDFGCLLDELEDCGYFVCWRTLDSQFARVFDRASGRFAGPVPQRRRRVYLVGSLGGPSAADILFERQSMLGDHPKGREAREALAEHLEGGAGMGDSAGFCRENSPAAGGIGYELKMSPTLRAGESVTNMVPGVLTSWDVKDNAPIALQSDGSSSNGSQNDCGYNVDGSAYTLNGRDRQAVAFAQNTRDEVCIFGGDGQVVGALAAQPGMKQTSYVCMESAQARAVIETDQSPTLNASHEQPIVCAADDNGKTAIEEDLCGSLKVGGGGGGGPG